MENFAFSLKSITASWLSSSSAFWVTDIILPILCGVGIFLLILPYLPYSPAESQLGEGRYPRKYEKDQRMRSRSRMKAETEQGSLQEWNDTRKPIDHFHSNPCKSPDKTVHQQFCYQGPRTRPSRARLKKYEENAECSQIWSQHTNIGRAQPRWKKHHENSEIFQPWGKKTTIGHAQPRRKKQHENGDSSWLWVQQATIDPASAELGTQPDKSDYHQLTDQVPKVPTADTARAITLSNVHNPLSGNLANLSSTQSAESQAPSELGSLSDHPPTIKSSGRWTCPTIILSHHYLVPPLSVLEHLSWLLSTILWLWASIICRLVSITAQDKSPQKHWPKAPSPPMFQSSGTEREDSKGSSMRSIKNKEHLFSMKHSSLKNGLVVQTHWSVCVLWEQLEQTLESHFKNKITQTERGLFPMRVRRSWLSLLCHYNTAVKIRSNSPSKGCKVHQSPWVDHRFKTTSVRPLNVFSTGHEETKKNLGRTTDDVCQGLSKALAPGQESRMPSQTTPSRMRERSQQRERGWSMTRSNLQDSPSSMIHKHGKKIIGPFPPDCFQKVALLEKNIEIKSLRVREATKELEKEKVPVWDVILGPSVRARPQTTNQNPSSFNSRIENVAAQERNELYLATKVANKFNLPANGGCKQNFQNHVTKYPKKSDTEVLLQDIATGVLIPDTPKTMVLQDSHTDVHLVADILAAQRAQTHSPKKRSGGDRIQLFLDHIFHGKRSQNQQEPSNQNKKCDSQMLTPTGTQSDVIIVERDDSTTDMDKRSEVLPSRLTEHLPTSAGEKKDSGTTQRNRSSERTTRETEEEIKVEAVEEDESTVYKRNMPTLEKGEDERRAKAGKNTEISQRQNSPIFGKRSQFLTQETERFRRSFVQEPRNEPDEAGGLVRESTGHFPHRLKLSKTVQGREGLAESIRCPSPSPQSQSPGQSRQIHKKEILAAHTIATVAGKILLEKLGLQQGTSASEDKQNSPDSQHLPGGNSYTQRGVTHPEKRNWSRNVHSFQQVTPQSHKNISKNKHNRERVLPPQELEHKARPSYQMSSISKTTEQSHNPSTIQLRQIWPVQQDHYPPILTKRKPLPQEAIRYGRGKAIIFP